MNKYNKHNYNTRRFRRQPSHEEEDLMETIKIAIKRKSVDRESFSDSRQRQRHIPSGPPMDPEEILDLIPSFNPMSSTLNPQQWINTVEDMKEIYGWDDRLTLVYASLRLQGEAKLWHKENLFQWPEFKIRFVEHFSRDEKSSDLYEQLLRRRKQFDETYEKYVFGVERMALKCGCNVEGTINFIISGLGDPSLQSKLIDCDCKTVDELWERIQAFTADRSDGEGDLRNRLGRHRRREEESEEKEAPFCWKCKKIGHSASICWSKKPILEDERVVHLKTSLNSNPASHESVKQRKVLCVLCKKMGHYSKYCPMSKICSHCKKRGHESRECRFKEDERAREERRRRNDRDSPSICRFTIDNDNHRDERWSGDDDRQHSEEIREESRFNIDVLCLKCQKPGHLRKDCTFDEFVCYFCNESGHLSKDCQARLEAFQKLREETREFSIPRSDQGRREGIFCGVCKKGGHFAKDCRFNKDRRERSLSRHVSEQRDRRIVGYCRICKIEGHFTRDCKLNGSPPRESPPRRNRFNEEHGGSVDRREVDIFCQVCKIGGHSMEDCKFNEQKAGANLLNESSYKRRSVFCRICKTGGHFRQECPKKYDRYKPKPGPDGWCRKCETVHHFMPECRMKESPAKGGEHSKEDDKEDPKSEGFCRICKKGGHFTRNCKLIQREGSIQQDSRPRRDGFCRICKIDGHFTRDCKLVEREGSIQQDSRSRRDGFCRICKKEGHFTRDCKFNHELDRVSRESEEKRPMICQLCYKKGHLTINCRLKVSERAGYCRICKMEGHFTRECKFNEDREEDIEEPPRRKGFCRICRIEGHYTKECKEGKFGRDYKHEANIEEPPAKKLRLPANQSVKLSPQETLTSSIRTNRNLSELLKPVRIDNVYVTALVNLGSDCTTLQRSEFEKHDWKMQPCHLQLNGFASGSSKTIGKISKNVCVGEVELVIDILVVEDDIQDFPLVLGSNFLDHPSVCVIKKYRSLEIKLVDDNTSATVAQPSTSLPDVPPFDGGLVKVKSEPMEEVAEDRLMEFLNMMEQDV